MDEIENEKSKAVLPGPDFRWTTLPIRPIPFSLLVLLSVFPSHRRKHAATSDQHSSVPSVTRLALGTTSTTLVPLVVATSSRRGWRLAGGDGRYIFYSHGHAPIITKSFVVGLERSPRRRRRRCRLTMPLRGLSRLRRCMQYDISLLTQCRLTGQVDGVPS